MDEVRNLDDSFPSASSILADMERNALKDVARLLTRRYPPVTYGTDDPEYLPIFVFHTLAANDFRQKLEFLQANGYQTIGLDEAVAWMSGDGKLPRRPVVLTIDDGRRSTWSIGAPLLEKFGMRATAYVIPGYLEEGPVRPTLKDVWEGRLENDALEMNERDDSQDLMRWAEVESLHSSGIIAIGSHTMLHRHLFVSPELTGFLTPDSVRSFYDIPTWLDDRLPWTRSRLAEAVGAPQFRSLPLLKARRAWLGGKRCHDACLSAVRKHGETTFFEQRNWSQQLKRVVGECGSTATYADVIEEKRWELQRSREALEARLGAAPVRHFCYPNSLGELHTIELTRQAGYKSSSWGLLDHRVTNRQGCSPYLLSRIKHDFVHSLPGEGRQSLLQILTAKVGRRVRGDTGY